MDPNELCPHGWKQIEGGMIKCLPSPAELEVVRKVEDGRVPSMTLIDFMGIGEKIYPKSPFLGLIILMALIITGIKLLRLLNHTGGNITRTFYQ